MSLVTSALGSARALCAVAVGLFLGLTPAHGTTALGLEELEQRLLQHLLDARSELGVPPLSAHPALSQAAEERALELSNRSELGSTSGEVTDLEHRLWRLGYAPHYWRLAVVAGHLDHSTIATTRLEPALLRNELEHVAISCFPWAFGRERTDEGIRAHPEDQTVCLIMVGERKIRHELRVAEPLRDIETVRREVLAEVNRIRDARGLVALERNALADLAAQRHAEDMLQRGFYSHRNPNGKGPRQRSNEAGYRPRAVGENIAKVVTSPVDAVARWMSSSGHRRNILRRQARDHGLGVAVGIDDGEVVALWCQLIAN